MQAETATFFPFFTMKPIKLYAKSGVIRVHPWQEKARILCGVKQALA